MGQRLSGKVAVVTGASSGIGRASAILFAKDGAKVVVADKDPAGGKSTVESIKAIGCEATFVECDVSNVKDAERLAESTIKTYGRIDALFNNAGINPVGTVVDTPLDVWDAVLDTNLKGIYLVSKFAIPHMKKNPGGGAIVNTASVDALLAILNEAAYIASKGGIVSLTKAMAVDHARDKIRVNCICPGAILTPLFDAWVKEAGAAGQDLVAEMTRMHPLGRIGTPEEVGRVALFLLSDEASFVTGAVVTVDGGYAATKERM